MNHIFTILLLCCFTRLLGQIGPCSIEGGDRSVDLFFKIDDIPDELDLGQEGEGNFWLFNALLKSPRAYTYKYTKASEGRYSSHFDDAQKVLREPFGKEIYFMSRGSIWYELGYVTMKKNSIEPLIVRYAVPIRACLRSGVTRQATSQVSFEIEEKTITRTYKDLKDASGTLYLEDGIYDADRYKRSIDIEGEGVARTTSSYLFIDQLTQDFLMEVQMSEVGETQKVIYKSKTGPRRISATNKANNFLLYPNTGYGEVRLEFTNFSPDRYRFIVFDLVGRKQWSTSYTIDGDITVKEDLSFLPRGTYTYTIVDSQQNRIVTRRLAIIKS